MIRLESLHKKPAQRIYELKATKSSIKSDQTINTNTRLAKYDQGVATPFFYKSETRPDKITIILDFPMIENHTIKLTQQSLIAKWYNWNIFNINMIKKES